jgi:hypothetical protein
MRQFITAILLSVICLLSFQDLTQLVLFKINQTSIIANLCVNKKDKVYTCHGKCQLSKIIAQSKDANSSDAPIPLSETEHLNFVYLIDNEQLITLDLTYSLVKSFSTNDKLLNSTHLSELLRPPIG